ncbi:hypothetical protein [Streptomyces sp. URMC 125]|uniref:hypothetical protein n=1 Tax=Streptomyces sp. URMC 125 TaxID=3423419 RepID=UPI003F1D2AC0
MWKRLRAHFTREEKRSSSWAGERLITRLSVDGRTRLLHRDVPAFVAEAVEAGSALLATEFSALTAVTPPYCRLAEVLGRGSEVTSECVVHCLRCFIRHDLTALALYTYLRGSRRWRKPPITECRQCGCPEAVMIYDSGLQERNGKPHKVRRVFDTGQRIEHIHILHSAAAAPSPDMIYATAEYISQGADISDCRITTRQTPSDYDHDRMCDLALAIVCHEEAEGLLSQDALLRTTTRVVRIPGYGPVVAAVVIGPD